MFDMPWLIGTVALCLLAWCWLAGTFFVWFYYEARKGSPD